MIRTLFAWMVGVVGSVGWVSFSMLASVFDPTGRRAHSCMVAWARLMLSGMGVEVRLSGLERVQFEAPQIFVVNHQSLVDIPALAAVLPVPFRFVAKVELFSVPFIGWYMRRAGFVPIERSHPRRAAKTVLEAAGRVREGCNLLMFPEGTRSEDGEVGPFLGGAFLLAERAAAAVVPIAIDGSASIVRKGSVWVRSGVVTVDILEPIRCGDRATLEQGAHLAIASALRQRRAQKA